MEKYEKIGKLGRGSYGDVILVKQNSKVNLIINKKL